VEDVRAEVRLVVVLEMPCQTSDEVETISHVLSELTIDSVDGVERIQAILEASAEL
jgi:acyl carrier protein